MKTTLLITALFALASCNQLVDIRTLPDGTRIETRSRTADPASIAAAVRTAELVAPIIADIAAKQKAEIAAEKTQPLSQ